MLQQMPNENSASTIETALIYQGVRLDTLVRLRWLAIAGQTIAVLVVGVVLQYPLPIVSCAILIGMAALLNVYSKLRPGKNLRVKSGVAALHLVFDICQLSGLLYLTGGLQNPFAFFLLAPVLISATTLRQNHTFTLGVLVVITSSILVDFHHPLPWGPDGSLKLPLLYVIGMWIALMACLLFMGSYTFRVANEARNLSAALTATELVLAREQHLSALDGMAAAAAHELGTPLSTISVVARELEREWPEDSPQGADIKLLSSQAKRCRDILGKLSSLNAESGGPMVAVRVTDLVLEIAEPHRNFGIEVNVKLHPSVADEVLVPLVSRLPGVLYGLGNIVENAVDFAKSAVEITVAWDEDVVIIKIVDDGPGFSENVAERLGEPYITSRQKRAPSRSTPVEGGGLGLGIFIAKTLLERSGATISFTNRITPHSGADVTILWPKESISFTHETMDGS